MSIFEDTNPRPLKELLTEINSRTMALPDFQRDFVWDPAATEELIVSIACNYPAGSILRVRDTTPALACRQFEGAPALDSHKHTFLVLDGQQRLTSLYQAFYGVGDHRYYVDLNKLLNADDFEEAIFHERSSAKWAKAMEQFELQAKDLILPLSVLKDGSGGFLDWIIMATNPLPPADRASRLDALTKINHQWIKTIDGYQFPVVTLSDKTDMAALCTIFETLNRTGIKLTVFELLTARFWPKHVNLRALWDDARKQHPIIRDFDVDPYYALQAISLACHGAPSSKRSDVLNLKASDIVDWWGRVTDGLAAGLTILRDDCQVALPKWLPYQTMIAPLAAVMAKFGALKGPAVGEQREKIKRWFWCAVFGQTYESSPNSESAKDVLELGAWLSGGPTPTTVTGLRFDPKILRGITPRQRATYRGTICLILGDGVRRARDFHTQAVITGKLMAQEGIDDHHVFPADYLDKKSGATSARVRDCVLNRTLIDRMTNEIISNRAPSSYLADIRKSKDFPLDEILDSHCLPTGDTSSLWTDDFETFLSWRQDRIWREIQRVTGLKDAADLESPAAHGK